jgi:hypothetical protein
MARYDGSPNPPAPAPGAGASNPDPSLVSGQDPESMYGIPLSYSTGFPGSEAFTPAGVGAGMSAPEGAVLGSAIVTTPGASSIPAQPVASIGAGDANLQSQSDLYTGRELLSGVSMIGETGIGHGHVRGPGGS